MDWGILIPHVLHVPLSTYIMVIVAGNYRCQGSRRAPPKWASSLSIPYVQCDLTKLTEDTAKNHLLNHPEYGRVRSIIIGVRPVLFGAYNNAESSRAMVQGIQTLLRCCSCCYIMMRPTKLPSSLSCIYLLSPRRIIFGPNPLLRKKIPFLLCMTIRHRTTCSNVNARMPFRPFLAVDNGKKTPR
jgi:hypothetical protein